MKIAIHQPNFIPWLGYFYKISLADVFVLLDDVQYTKNSFINRNRIKTPDKEQWLTVPVIHSGNFGQKINETTLFSPEVHLNKIRNSLRGNYSKAPYFREVFDLLDRSMGSDSSIAAFNEKLIRAIAGFLGIETKIIRSGELEGIKGESTERLISICQKLGADEYIAGFGSRNYQEDEKFIMHGINTGVYNFSHPVYEQLWGDFIPNLSIIDLLFNYGKDSKKFLS